MSTRCTIWYAKAADNEGVDLHLYAEAFDDSVWLEIEQGPVCVTLPLPQEMVKAILGSGVCQEYAEHGPDTSWIDDLPSPKP